MSQPEELHESPGLEWWFEDGQWRREEDPDPDGSRLKPQFTLRFSKGDGLTIDVSRCISDVVRMEEIWRLEFGDDSGNLYTCAYTRRMPDMMAVLRDWSEIFANAGGESK